ncbi:MAG TPA: PKD domain-containing protein [Bacteroidia bacterium]|nr:PKD domain-containing protein [Bacteroidia bacterium]
MKKVIAILIMLSVALVKAQPTYLASNYAQANDSVYLTQAQLVSLNFDTTGASFTWDFSALTGVGQRKVNFRLPTQVGYSIAQWAYLYNSNNVNLSSTDHQSIQLGGSLSATNPNDYFYKSNSVLQQKASSYEITTNTLNLKIKNVYSSPDIIYHFPINYLNIDSSTSGYTTTIPGIYYRSSIINRVNVVDGWGSVTTPYGTYSNCLRVASTITQIDSFAVDTFSTPSTLLTYRELKWLDFSKKYPVLFVKQIKVGNNFVTQSIEYLDNQQFFQPSAYFAYYPTVISVGDTVQFQNLSSNGQSYQWNFGDPNSGTNNQSNAFNPIHIYNTADTFYVSLIVMNGTLSDTLILPLIVNSGNAPVASFSTNTNNVCAGNSVQFTNTSVDGFYYQWYFPGGSPSNSILQNPPQVVYNASGTYEVKLVVTNSNGVDSVMQNIVVESAPAAAAIPQGIQLFCQNDISSDYTINTVNGATAYQWSVFPANAATVNSSTNNATVYWNMGYTGTLWLKCAGVNTCGIGTVLDSLPIEITICTALEPYYKTTWKIGPNPASSVIYFNPHDSNFESLIIKNATGITVKNIDLKQTQSSAITIDINDMAAGVYFIQLQSAQQSVQQTIYIIK